MAIFRGTAGNDTANAALGFLSSGFQNGDDDTLALFLDSIGDFIVGFDGEDFIFAGPGNDRIEGGGGFDRLNGAEGNDTIYANYQVDVAGSLIGDEILGNIGDDILIGSSGDDRIEGGDGFDQLYGRAGADQLFGGDGVDYFNYSSETVAAGEIIDGGVGVDRLNVDGVVDFTAAASITGVEGIRLFGPATAIMTAQQFKASGMYFIDLGGSLNSPAQLVQIEMRDETTLDLSAISIYADTLNDEVRVIGDASNETIIGNTWQDTILGNGGNDSLTGLAGRDVLTGGFGLDVLTGGLGPDVLTGGADNDRFDFNTVRESGLTSATRDVITDFDAGFSRTSVDRIDVSTIDANIALARDQAFLFGGAFDTGHIRAIQSGADVLLEFNTDADTAAEMTILLSNVAVGDLNSGDFIL